VALAAIIVRPTSLRPPEESRIEKSCSVVVVVVVRVVGPWKVTVGWYRVTRYYTVAGHYGQKWTTTIYMGVDP